MGSTNSRYAGSQVIGAILSGTYTQRSEFERFELDTYCPDCGTELTATYEEERVTVRCETCDENRSTFGLPPGAFEGRDEDELQNTFERWLLNVFSLMADGICLRCSGKTVGSLVTESEYFYSDQDAGIEFVCERCGDQRNGQHRDVSPPTSGGRRISLRPRHRPHRRSPSGNSKWLNAENAIIVSEDPIVVSSTITLDGDELTLTVDEELAVHVE